MSSRCYAQSYYKGTIVLPRVRLSVSFPDCAHPVISRTPDGLPAKYFEFWLIGVESLKTKKEKKNAWFRIQIRHPLGIRPGTGPPRAATPISSRQSRCCGRRPRGACHTVHCVRPNTQWVRVGAWVTWNVAQCHQRANPVSRGFDGWVRQWRDFLDEREDNNNKTTTEDDCIECIMSVLTRLSLARVCLFKGFNLYSVLQSTQCRFLYISHIIFEYPSKSNA
jgi:hypothetical protein